ncbi:cation diffusion facilitator family transporter [Psychrobacillus sp. L3]|uniref:cation diffusion facilitator family transporter n=1 Tax=Psychrobacillus sp. L3 TaxID=3236891 RepID=UPI0036F1AD72
MSLEKKQSSFAIWISLISNVFLTILKIIVGLLFNSQVLLADGVHNAGDVIASVAALSAMRVSKRPPDEDHPYGHGKAEVVGAAIVAIILGIAALYIGYHSVLSLFETPHKATFTVLIAAIISLIWKQVLYVYTINIGKKVNSKGLIATAYDHLADVYASLAAVIGIGLAMIGDYFHIGILAYGDPVAGIIVAFLVLKLAIGMGRESIDVLMEKTVDSETMEIIFELVRSVPLVKRIDRIRAREHGHYIIVDVRVSLPATLSIQEGHDVSKEIKKAIKNRFANVEEVLVHVNPWYEIKEVK